ncbi:LysR substrate-binding domain-containing protein [Mucilaginibacter sp. CSA2-8R]|uniref:LysR substrate-binding domain-containing protein n=1 Tax=Mucilaginibacter sp. CSA2-8R TaxID=3141542 RepID=UPI00315DE9D9
MELRQLKYFIKAAELQNFTEAAGALYITQSTLSQQVKQLEDELGIPLFDRIAKRVRLTEAGRMFLPYANKTIRDASDGKNILKDLMSLSTGTLNIGVTYGLTDLLAKAVLNFSKQFPDIHLEIIFGTTQDLLKKLDQSHIDMMLSFSQEEKPGSYKIERLFSSCLALIVHANHPLAIKQQIAFEELKDLSLILPSKGFSIRNHFDHLLSHHDVDINMQMEVNDINMLLQLVDSGNWATILMESSIFNHPELKAVKLAGNSMTRQASITWPIGVYCKKPALLLAQQLAVYANNYQS